MDKKEIDNIVKLIKTSSKITVFTGAGISTSCGIPDFRGEKGLYNIVRQKYNLPYPEAIFDINYFKSDPIPFYDLSKNFFDDNIEPSLSHKFIAWLEKNNKISLVMTQNIDMLHQKAGSTKVLECHGTYAKAHCLSCKKKYDLKEIENSIKLGKIPYCACKGIIKPDIVFFGEQLPLEFFESYQDLPETDLLIVMGTTLAVQPAAGFAIKLANITKSIIVNLDPTQYDHIFTHVIHCDLDTFSKEIWEKL